MIRELVNTTTTTSPAVKFTLRNISWPTFSSYLYNGV